MQSGFRKNHSCHTALTHLIDTWLKDIDSGNYVGAVFLDLRKAFDLVDHEILIHKLKLYHFSENTVKLFESYLSNRNQLIKIKNLKSDILSIKSGVPQGSILGPLLFLLYMNDIASISNTGSTDLYADDTTVCETSNDLRKIQIQLQIRLNLISNWCTQNNMSIHPAKTKCMVISTCNKLKLNKELYLTINDVVIENVTVHKLLGVYIDNTLSWNTQIKKICSKLNSKIALLKRISYYLTYDMKLLFYNAYIMSTFDYCCTVWGNGKAIQNTICKTQKRIARIILNVPIKTSSIEMFTKLKWLPFSKRYFYHIVLLIFKSRNNLAPRYISNLLTFSNNTSYNLRSIDRKDLVHKKARTNYLKQSFSYNSTLVWNKIPSDLRNVSNLYSFKYSLKKYLLNDQI